jgi:hypothetical protein
MSYDVISAVYVQDYKIHVAFENGKSGIADLSSFIARGGIFTRLRDLDYFKTFKINADLGVLTWENQIDIAPETLYSCATGEPLPEWMQPANNEDER